MVKKYNASYSLIFFRIDTNSSGTIKSAQMGTNTTIAISAVQWENIGDIKTSTFKKVVNIDSG